MFFKYSVIISICLAPIAVFLAKPTSPEWKKNLKFLLPIALFTLSIFFASSFHECVYNPQYSGCWRYKLGWLSLGIIVYIAGLGVCEITWRQYYKLPFWPLKENLKYGILSNLSILISIIITLLLFYLAALNWIWFPLLDSD